jgi:hypothetical protein
MKVYFSVTVIFAAACYAEFTVSLQGALLALLGYGVTPAGTVNITVIGLINKRQFNLVLDRVENKNSSRVRVRVD